MDLLFLTIFLCIILIILLIINNIIDNNKTWINILLSVSLLLNCIALYKYINKLYNKKLKGLGEYYDVNMKELTEINLDRCKRELETIDEYNNHGDYYKKKEQCNMYHDILKKINKKPSFLDKVKKLYGNKKKESKDEAHMYGEFPKASMYGYF